MSVVGDITNPPGDDDAFVKVGTCRTREKSRNAALWTGTDQDVCSCDCASTAMKEFDVWLLAVADRAFLRLVVYPEADTGFVKKSTASGMRCSDTVSRSKRMWAPRRRGAMFQRSRRNGERCAERGRTPEARPAEVARWSIERLECVDRGSL